MTSGRKAKEVSSETNAVLAFPMWDVSDEADGDNAFNELYVEHTDRERTELHRVTAVEMAVRIGVKVSRVDLTHARLGSVTVAYGELDGESLTGVFVASRGASHAETLTLHLTNPIAHVLAAPPDEGGRFLPTDWTPLSGLGDP